MMSDHYVLNIIHTYLSVTLIDFGWTHRRRGDGQLLNGKRFNDGSISSDFI